MNSASALIFLAGLVSAYGIPSLVGVPAAGVAVVPAGLTVSSSALAAAKQQLAYQINQASRASVTNAIALAQMAQSLGNQANNAAVRDSVGQSNAERVQASNNLAQNARNALSQAQAAQQQVLLSNSAAQRNSAIQILQGNSAAQAQAIQAGLGNSLAASIAGAPIVLPTIALAGPAVLAGNVITAAGVPVVGAGARLVAAPVAVGVGGRVAIKG